MPHFPFISIPGRSILLIESLTYLFFQFSLTPLHLAAWYGQESVVNMLLEHGADVNATDRVSIRNQVLANN